MEGAAEPRDESPPAAAPLLLTRIHPYCTGRGEDRAQKANKRSRVSPADRGHGFGSPGQAQRSRLHTPESGLKRGLPPGEAFATTFEKVNQLDSLLFLRIYSAFSSRVKHTCTRALC